MRKGTVVDAHAAYIALTADVITEYCYGYNQDHLGSPDFSKDLKDIMITLFQGLQVRRQVPLLMYVMVELPADWLLKMIIPSLGAMIDFQNYLEREVKRVVKRKKTDAKAEEKESILTTLLDNPDLPPQEKTVPRMKDEAFVLIAAGAETTGKTLAETTFHILNTPGVLPRLREELKTVMPKSTDLPTWSQLEQLPYLVSSAWAQI
jgi:cytochrome P450